VTHADQMIQWLHEMGYTHCFFVSGGNSMHLLNAARQKMTCVPVVHEVSAGIAAEYFNESHLSEGKAFVLVTAGPGLTNLVTALAGAYLESRELLVLGGQVKSSDLATNGLRQRGIQEIDGVAISQPISKAVFRVEQPISQRVFTGIVRQTSEGRKGPVVIEVCLDAQGAPVQSDPGSSHDITDDNLSLALPSMAEVNQVRSLLAKSSKPMLLLGGGLSRQDCAELLPLFEKWGIPVTTTWNAADRMDSSHDLYFGRPNTWGQRSSNLISQQADLLIAAGTRLGLQQTGFNWSEFVPHGEVVQIDLDKGELEKGHPKLTHAIWADAASTLRLIFEDTSQIPDWSIWRSHSRRIRQELPLSEEVNGHHQGFLNPFEFALTLSDLCNSDDTVVPCSSGGAFTVMMQAFNQKIGQIIITNKGLASMGYGLAGAIGAALADRSRRSVLVEGDGGFSQNLQELATVAVQKLNLKMFIFANNGYASIRMTQKNYFDGAYLGCDIESGLGFPDWQVLSQAFGIKSMTLSEGFQSDQSFLESWRNFDPCLYVVPVHPEQTFFPKIASQVTTSGSMESAPLHRMTPLLSDEVLKDFGIVK
jgi:acetolactate synthase I/II/III large subunit